MFQSLKNAIGSRVSANAKAHAAANKAAPTGKVVKDILPTTADYPLTNGHTTLNYYMSTIRWHLDTREHASLLLLHDIGSHPNSWSQLNVEASKLPNKGLTPTVPLNLYMPHLRNHGDGAKISNSVLGDYVKDVVAFTNEVILPTSPVHIVGLGFGARIGMLAALMNPSRIESVTAITHGNPFGSLPSANARLEHLASIVRESKSLAEVNARLMEAVTNETERLNLLLSVKEARSPEGKVLSLLLDSEELIRSCNGSMLKWPALRNEDGTEGDAAAVAEGLRAHTGGVKCHVIKSTMGGATSCDTQALKALFANTEVSEIPANFNYGMIRPQDTEVVLHKVLDKVGLVGAMADSTIEGAKTAALMQEV